MTVSDMLIVTNNSSIAGGIADSSDSLDRYIGKTVRIWPYLRGYYRKDLLYQLWSLVAQANAFHQLFWGLHLDESKHGDLEHFCRYFAEDAGRILFIVQDVNKDELAGFIWFDDLIPNYRAIGSIFMMPAYRGKSAEEAMRLVCDYGFTVLALQMIWGITPWPHAASLIRRIGFQQICRLPDFASIQGHPHDVQIFRLTKERFYGFHLSERF